MEISGYTNSPATPFARLIERENSLVVENWETGKITAPQGSGAKVSIEVSLTAAAARKEIEEIKRQLPANHTLTAPYAERHWTLVASWVLVIGSTIALLLAVISKFRPTKT